jgi:16S rRNA (adenine1518-N6/adenine1519-N6)-dimethyltransferase
MTDAPTQPLNHHDPRAVLRAHDLWAKKKFGQNFLIDPSVPARIALSGGVSASDRVFEIGAGVGTLTRVLAGRAASVTALEIDRELIPILKAETATAGNVTVREGDVRSIDWAAEAEAAGGPLLVYGNIPYNLSSEIVSGLLEAPAGTWTRACLLLQLEFAERVAAAPGEDACGTLSALAWLYSHPTLVFGVPAAAFHPAPKVDSAVLVLERRAQPAVDADPVIYRRLVKALFAQRRKMARKALKPICGDPEALCASVGIDAMRRGETFSLTELGALAKALPGFPPGA